MTIFVPKSSYKRKRRFNDDTLRFGIFWPYSRALIPSAEVAARNPDVLDANNHARFAQEVEQAGFDFVLLADGYSPASPKETELGFQDPSIQAVLWSIPILLATQNLGVLSTIHTTFTHPVQIARWGGNLDEMSGGRWGWNIVNGYRDRDTRLFGGDGVADRDSGYELAEENVKVVKALWADPEFLEHDGARYSVHGRVRRPLPGVERPLLVNAAASSRGREFASEACDYLMFNASDPALLGPMVDDLRSNNDKSARTDPTQALLLVDILVRDEPGRAAEDYAAIMDSRDQSSVARWNRDTAKATTGTGFIVGTPAEVAEQLLELKRIGIKGMLTRQLEWSPGEVSRFVPVMDILRRAGAWVPPAERDYSW